MSLDHAKSLIDSLNEPADGTYEDREKLLHGLGHAVRGEIDAYPVWTTEGGLFKVIFTEHDDFPSPDTLDLRFRSHPLEGLILGSRFNIDELTAELERTEHFG